MLKSAFRGLITLPALGDQALDFPPFVLRIGIFLFDFTRNEQYAFFRDFEDDRGALLKAQMFRIGAGTVTWPLDVILATSVISMKSPYILTSILCLR